MGRGPGRSACKVSDNPHEKTLRRQTRTRYSKSSAARASLASYGFNTRRDAFTRFATSLQGAYVISVSIAKVGANERRVSRRATEVRVTLGRVYDEKVVEYESVINYKWACRQERYKPVTMYFNVKTERFMFFTQTEELERVFLYPDTLGIMSLLPKGYFMKKVVNA